jgi:hypothetical protein
VQGYGGVEEQTSRPVVQAAVAGAEKVVSAEKTSRCVGIDRNGNAVMAPATSSNAASGRACVKGSQFTHAAPAATLPFTGVQLGVFVAVGLALLAGGLLVRRFGRTTHP